MSEGGELINKETNQMHFSDAGNTAYLQDVQTYYGTDFDFTAPDGWKDPTYGSLPLIPTPRSPADDGSDTDEELSYSSDGGSDESPYESSDEESDDDSVEL